MERVRADHLVRARSLGMGGECGGGPGVSSQLYTSLLAEQERLEVAGLAFPHLDLNGKLATDLITGWLPTTQLVLTAMYSSNSPLNPESSLGPVPSLTPRA